MAVPRPRRRYIFTSIRISLHLEGFAQLRLESNVGSHFGHLGEPECPNERLASVWRRGVFIKPGPLGNDTACRSSQRYFEIFYEKFVFNFDDLVIYCLGG